MQLYEATHILQLEGDRFTNMDANKNYYRFAILNHPDQGARGNENMKRTNVAYQVVIDSLSTLAGHATAGPGPSDDDDYPTPPTRRPTVQRECVHREVQEAQGVHERALPAPSH